MFVDLLPGTGRRRSEKSGRVRSGRCSKTCLLRSEQRGRGSIQRYADRAHHNQVAIFLENVCKQMHGTILDLLRLLANDLSDSFRRAASAAGILKHFKRPSESSQLHYSSLSSSMLHAGHLPLSSISSNSSVCGVATPMGRQAVVCYCIPAACARFLGDAWPSGIG